MPQKLFVGNLPHSVTDAELNDFVTQAASALVVRDKFTGQSRGFGFVELAEGQDMERAIQGLNGQTLGGRSLTVNEARPPRNDFQRSRQGGGSGGGDFRRDRGDDRGDRKRRF
jgi:cold-inducible RNA-binding protein